MTIEKLVATSRWILIAAVATLLPVLALSPVSVARADVTVTTAEESTSTSQYDNVDEVEDEENRPLKGETCDEFQDWSNRASRC